MQDAKAEFVYVIYIRTTVEKLWRALIEPEFTVQYWAQCRQESDWKQGAAWRIMRPDGVVADSGQVLEIEPHKRLVLSWRNEFRPELTAEGHSRLTYELEQQGDIIVTEESAKKMQQQKMQAQQPKAAPAAGKKGAPAPPATAGTPPAPATTPSPAADGKDKQIRSVGPTFIPNNNTTTR